MESERAISIAWQTAVMPVPAFIYFHDACYQQCEPRATWQAPRSLLASDLAPGTPCFVCGEKVRGK